MCVCVYIYVCIFICICICKILYIDMWKKDIHVGIEANWLAAASWTTDLDIRQPGRHRG